MRRRSEDPSPHHKIVSTGVKVLCVLILRLSYAKPLSLISLQVAKRKVPRDEISTRLGELPVRFVNLRIC